MNKTKRKILDNSLALFNDKGLKDVTLRAIAQSLDISQGNLNYHFKTKDELLNTLYYELVAKIDREMQGMLQAQTSLHYLYQSSFTTMKCFYEYRFFMRDLYKILKENDEIKSHYTTLQTFRNQQFSQLFHDLIEAGIIRPEAFENEYARFYIRMRIIGDNWINSEDLAPYCHSDFIHYNHQLLFELIYPYLTDYGRIEYMKIKM
ncbi:MAG: TetR family transcriptional regulator [Cyclobacteriaceae bacterium]|nr:TetR family transcriptional regulator [Cyclobacteriaceae bacterium]